MKKRKEYKHPFQINLELALKKVYRRGYIRGYKAGLRRRKKE